MVQTLELIEEFRNELQFAKDVKAGLYDEKYDLEPEYRHAFLLGRFEATIEITLAKLETSLPKPEDDPKESPLGYNPYME